MDASFLWQPPRTEATSLDDSVKWLLIRLHRATLLAACDWTQLPDAALSLEEKQSWSDYRQSLRDIPQDFTNPDDAIIPDPPL